MSGCSVVAVPGEDAVPAVAERRDERERVADGVDREHVLGRSVSRTSASMIERSTALPGERQAERVPHRAVHAVGADQVVGPYVSAPAGACADA